MKKIAKKPHGGPFAAFDRSMTTLPVFLQMSGESLKLLHALLNKHNGRNNGELFIGRRDACAAMKLSPKTVVAAFRELEERGFAVRVSLGKLTGRRATEWRLTMLPCDGEEATHDYRRWRPGLSLAPTITPAPARSLADNLNTQTKNGTTNARAH